MSSHEIKRINPSQRFSDATIFQQTIYYVEIPNNYETTGKDSIDLQAENLLSIAKDFLEKNGSGLDQLLMTTIYLTNMQDYNAMNTMWEKFIPNGKAPARACVQVSALAHPDIKIEMAFVASIKSL